MRIELKNVKVHADMTQETTCFSAVVYADGRKAGTVQNEGRGGPNIYHWTDSALGALIEAWAKTQPLQFDFEHLDQIIGRLLSSCELRQRLRRYTRKETLFRLKGDKKGDWRTVRAKFSLAVETFLREKYGDEVECVANADLDKAAAYCD